MKEAISKKILLKEAGVFLIASVIILSTASVAANTVVSQAIMSIPGDCDGDGDVDQQDLGILLAAWDSHPGDDNWDDRADFDGDDYVGQSDLGILLANWGAGT